MLDTKCNQDNLNKFKHENANQFQLASDKETSFEDYSNLISNYRRTDLVFDAESVSRKIEKTKRHQTKFKSEIELRNKADIANDESVIEIDGVYCENRSSDFENSKLTDRLSGQNLSRIDNEKSEKQCVDLAEKGCSSGISQLGPTNDLNSLDDKNRLKTCTQVKNTQTKSSEQSCSTVIQQPETSAQSNQHSSLQPCTSQQITHPNENPSVHFANKFANKLHSISIGHFSVYLDRLDYEYRPSETLTGKLHILLESGQLNLRRIVIYLKGISSVKFTEREYQSTSQNEKHFEDVEYWSDHYLMELKTRPKLCAELNNVRVLEPGEYHLPFKFTFPINGIPSSFESPFGYIRYWIYSEIRSKDRNRDVKEKDQSDEDKIATSELPVEVYAPCSIPIEELRRPINAEQLKVMGCLSCCTCLFRNPDFIQVRANIMHQGQRKGSSVQINLLVVNRSRKQIQPYIILKARNEYRATNKTKIDEVELNGCPGTLVNSGQTNMQTILIPLKYEYPIIYDSPNIIISYRIKILIEIPNSFDINFPQLPIYLVSEKFPLKQHNYV